MTIVKIESLQPGDEFKTGTQKKFRTVRMNIDMSKLTQIEIEFGCKPKDKRLIVTEDREFESYANGTIVNLK